MTLAGSFEHLDDIYGLLYTEGEAWRSRIAKDPHRIGFR